MSLIEWGDFSIILPPCKAARSIFLKKTFNTILNDFWNFLKKKKVAKFLMSLVVANKNKKKLLLQLEQLQKINTKFSDFFISHHPLKLRHSSWTNHTIIELIWFVFKLKKNLLLRCRKMDESLNNYNTLNTIIIVVKFFCVVQLTKNVSKHFLIRTKIIKKYFKYIVILMRY